MSPSTHSSESNAVAELLQRAIARHGESVFASVDGHPVSYRTMGEETRELSRQLVQLGVQAGDRVLVVNRCPLSTARLVFACSWLSAVFVVLDESTSDTNLRHIVTDCQPRLVVADRLPACVDGYEHCELGSLPCYRRSSANAALAELGRGFVAIVYTSGSTGHPKGVALSSRNIRFSVNAILQRLRYAPADTVAVYLPLSFDYGLYQLFLACSAGCRVVIRKQAPTSALLAQALQADGITVFPAVPSLCSALALGLKARQAAPALHRLRMVTSTGQSLAPALLDELKALLPAVAFYPMYGLTECKRVSILLPHEQASKRGSVGRPLDGTRVTVVGENGAVLAPGEQGQLVVEGDHVAAYWGEPAQGSSTFRTEDGRRCLYTGDYGHVDADSFIYWEGRRDGIVKRNAVRISLAEIDNRLHEQAEVAGAATVADPSSSQLVAFVVMHGGAAGIPSQALVERLRATLEPLKIPDQVVAIERLPLTPNGKVDRQALLAWWQGRHPSRAGDGPRHGPNVSRS